MGRGDTRFGSSGVVVGRQISQDRVWLNTAAHGADAGRTHLRTTVTDRLAGTYSSRPRGEAPIRAVRYPRRQGGVDAELLTQRLGHLSPCLFERGRVRPRDRHHRSAPVLGRLGDRRLAVQAVLLGIQADPVRLDGGLAALPRGLPLGCLRSSVRIRTPAAASCGALPALTCSATQAGSSSPGAYTTASPSR